MQLDPKKLRLCDTTLPKSDMAFDENHGFHKEISSFGVLLFRFPGNRRHGNFDKLTGMLKNSRKHRSATCIQISSRRLSSNQVSPSFLSQLSSSSAVIVGLVQIQLRPCCSLEAVRAKHHLQTPRVTSLGMLLPAVDPGKSNTDAT